MKVTVIRTSENLKRAAGQIAMLCRSNLRSATCIEQLIDWADDIGFNKMEWEKVSLLALRVSFENSHEAAEFLIEAE